VPKAIAIIFTIVDTRFHKRLEPEVEVKVFFTVIAGIARNDRPSEISSHLQHETYFDRPDGSSPQPPLFSIHSQNDCPGG